MPDAPSLAPAPLAAPPAAPASTKSWSNTLKLSLLLPYLDAAQRSHLQALTGAYAPPQAEGTAP